MDLLPSDLQQHGAQDIEEVWKYVWEGASGNGYFAWLSGPPSWYGTLWESPSG